MMMPRPCPSSSRLPKAFFKSQISEEFQVKVEIVKFQQFYLMTRGFPTLFMGKIFAVQLESCSRLSNKSSVGVKITHLIWDLYVITCRKEFQELPSSTQLSILWNNFHFLNQLKRSLSYRDKQRFKLLLIIYNENRFYTKD